MMFHWQKKAEECPKEAIEWAAKRIGLSYEELQLKLTSEERAGIKAAYEAWKRRTS